MNNVLWDVRLSNVEIHEFITLILKLNRYVSSKSTKTNKKPLKTDFKRPPFEPLIRLHQTDYGRLTLRTPKSSACPIGSIRQIKHLR